MSVPARPLLTAGAVAGTIAYSFGAACTTPFTVAADVVTAIPILALGIAAVVCWPLHPVRDAPCGGAAAAAGRPSEDEGLRPRSDGHPYRAWVALTAAVVAWELAQYLAPGSRGAHPTLSSMADAADRLLAVKAAVFLAWLWLGVFVVVSGRARATDGPRP